MFFWRLTAGLLLLLFLNGFAGAVATDTYTWSTFAGLPRGWGNADGTGSGARFNGPRGIAVDALGNVFVADTSNNVIRKITSANVVSTFAGAAGSIGSADGTGSAARFYSPGGVAVDASGNVFVADTGNNVIRKITSAGVVSTFAGASGSVGTTDGTGSAARFNNPQGVAVDALGNLFVADTGNSVIRKITSGRLVSTFARCTRPRGVAVDASGNVFAPLTSTSFIQKFTSAGVVSFFFEISMADPLFADLSSMVFEGIAVDASGNLVVVDTHNHVIRRISSAGTLSTFAGPVGMSGSADGTGSAARFNSPQGVAVDASGNLFVADTYNHVIRRISNAGVVSTFAGVAGSVGSTDGTGSAARFWHPSGVAVDTSGNVFVSDSGTGVIRKITSAGVVSTFAGTAGAFGSTDGTGGDASFGSIYAIAVDASGNLFVVDSNTVRKITSAGVVSTFAGAAGSGGSTDGTGSDARFNAPGGIAVDASGNVFVSDTYNHVIRKITSAGVVSTFAGAARSVGSTDGTGSSARFNRPRGIAVDASGNVYVADTGNNVIRKITSAGVVSTFAGTAGSVGSTDGTGSAALFSEPFGIAVDASGNIYVSDPSADVIRRGFAALSPTISTHPVSVSVTLDSSASLSVKATGTAPISYQWRKNGINISGATDATYTINRASAADSSSYDVVVTNVGGSVTSNAATITVNKASQIIGAFAVIGSQIYGDQPFAVTAPVASSGLSVSVTVKSGPATITNGTLCLTGVGTVVLAANQSGDANYSPATEVTTSFLVNKASQSIAGFGIVPSKVYGDPPFAVPVPAATSGLGVVLSVKSGPATVSGNTVTITGAGTVVLVANQSGDANYSSATEVTTSFLVNKASQIIAGFGIIPSKAYGDAPFAVPVPAATSGLSVVLGVKSGPATVSGNTVTGTGVGTVVLVANQSGDANYSSAAEVTTSFLVNKASQSIAGFGIIPSKVYGDPPFAVPVPAATSGLSVVLSVKSGPATVSGNTVSITGAGTVVLAANQGGDANYSSSTEATTSFVVDKAIPVIHLQPTASAITFGQSLSSSVLSGGSASVPGKFAFASVLTVPGIGTAVQPVTFTPIDSSRHDTASTSVSVTVRNSANLPVIASPSVTTGTVGAAFAYQIVSSNNPNFFEALGLPAGLSVNGITGLISGTPATAGQATITLRATNSAGTGAATLALTIAHPTLLTSPYISSGTLAYGIVGSPFTYQIIATNNPTSFGANGLPSGLNLNASTGVISGSLSSAGQFQMIITASNSSGSGSTKLTLKATAASADWPNFAGTYEGLLKQSPHSPLVDTAAYCFGSAQKAG
jgi:sugar lactone lactonase YvrE